ncbi:transposase family protein [Myxococcota bacterium]|nr:transposase family protein [Myxococcota bacterium]
MQQNEIFAFGLGLTSPWELIDQRLDVDKAPNELHLRIEADRGSSYPCPDCGKMCKAHYFKELTWRHLNFFQHHCFITAPVPRTNCADHGVKRVEVPWARKGSQFTLLFEQADMTLVREMPAILTLADFSYRLVRLMKKYHNILIGIACTIAIYSVFLGISAGLDLGEAPGMAFVIILGAPISILIGSFLVGKLDKEIEYKF